MKPNILITGASGFIGSFIVEEALKQGMETWAAIRPNSSKAYLTDNRINFIHLDFSSQQQMETVLQNHRFDYVVHAAGVTKCLHADEFYRMNTEGTKNFVQALLATKQPLKRFVYLSSLSVFGPIREEMPYREITEHDHPRPNTHYGKSKLQAEAYLDSVGNAFPYIVLRPTGVYGPREKDYFMMVKSIAAHTDFAVGYKPQDITFVYVTDVVQAVFLSLNRGMSGRKYFLSDGQVYRSSAFSNYIRKALGNPFCLRITAPIWLLKAITAVGDRIGRRTGKITALNTDKYHILKQRNWRCDIEPAMDELGYHPHVQLEEGVRKTVQWYKQAKWI